MSREPNKRKRQRGTSTLDLLDAPPPELTMDPFEVLGVSRNADDATIRRAYLDLVRQYPPEQAPDMFKRIRQAYEWLETPQQRAAALVFTPNALEGTDLALGAPNAGPNVAGIPVAFLLARDPFSDLGAVASDELSEAPHATGKIKARSR